MTASPRISKPKRPIWDGHSLLSLSLRSGIIYPFFKYCFDQTTAQVFTVYWQDQRAVYLNRSCGNNRWGLKTTGTVNCSDSRVFPGVLQIDHEIQLSVGFDQNQKPYPWRSAILCHRVIYGVLNSINIWLLPKLFRGKIFFFFLERAPDWNIPELYFHITVFS